MEGDARTFIRGSRSKSTLSLPKGSESRMATVRIPSTVTEHMTLARRARGHAASGTDAYEMMTRLNTMSSWIRWKYGKGTCHVALQEAW